MDMTKNCRVCESKMDEVFSADLKLRKGWFCKSCFSDKNEYFIKAIGRERKNDSGKR